VCENQLRQGTHNPLIDDIMSAVCCGLNLITVLHSTAVMLLLTANHWCKYHSDDCRSCISYMKYTKVVV